MRSRQGSTATSRRLHVATSPSHDVEVNYYRSQPFPTSRRHHVATSPRRDVTTSRRHHVATSPRRDVTTSQRLPKILHLIIKCEGLGNLGYIGGCAARDTILETCNTDLKILLGFLYWFLFICLFGYFWII